jgi:Ca2+-binding RTX toxin-like protein
VILYGDNRTRGPFEGLDPDEPRWGSDALATALADRLEGTDATDRLVGFRLDDTLLGGDGDDLLAGGSGSDVLAGGDGNDALSGDASYRSELGYGGDQNPTLGRDTLRGGMGDDGLEGGSREDLLEGEDGDDWLGGSLLYGFLYLVQDHGDGAADTMLGGAGSDTIVGGVGDLLDGGEGDDEYWIVYDSSGATASIAPDPGNGRDRLVIALGPNITSLSHDLGPVTEFVALYVRPDTGLQSFTLRGDADDERMLPQTLIYGGTSASVPVISIDGGGGNDTLIAGFGADTLTGGSGSDQFRTSAKRLPSATLITDLEPAEIIRFDAASAPQPAPDDPPTPIPAGNGSTLLSGQWQVGWDSTRTFLRYGYDSVPGADGLIVLLGRYASDAFVVAADAEGSFIQLQRQFFTNASNAVNFDILTVDQASFIRSLTAAERAGGVLHEARSGNDAVTLPGAASGADLAHGAAPPVAFDRTRTFEAGEGADTVTGSALADRIAGGGGEDSLIGLGGADTIEGGPSRDRIRGGEGADSLLGGEGDDRFFLHAPAELAGDTISGDDGQDRLRLEGAGIFDLRTATLTSVERVDVATDDPVSLVLGDALFAGVSATPGRFLVAGAIGALLDIQPVKTGVKVDAGSVSAGNAIIFAGATRTTADGTFGFQGADTVTGGAGSDSLAGGAAEDLIDGGIGADTLDGGEFVDTLIGGAGADRLIGGPQDPLTIGLSFGLGRGFGDVASYADAAGPVAADLSGAMVGTGDGAGDSFQNIAVLLGSRFNDTFAGNSSFNRLIGGDGDDRLDGGAGFDRLDGGTGNDQLLGGEGNDSLFGEQDNDTLSGGLGSDTLDGGDGNDVLYAQDFPIFGPVSEPEGRSRLLGGAGDDQLFSLSSDPSLANELLGGSGTDRFWVDDNDLIRDLEQGEFVHVQVNARADSYVVFSSDAGTRLTFFEGPEGDQAKVGTVDLDERIHPTRFRLESLDELGRRYVTFSYGPNDLAVREALKPVAARLLEDVLKRLELAGVAPLAYLASDLDPVGGFTIGKIWEKTAVEWLAKKKIEELAAELITKGVFSAAEQANLVGKLVGLIAGVTLAVGKYAAAASKGESKFAKLAEDLAGAMAGVLPFGIGDATAALGKAFVETLIDYYFEQQTVDLLRRLPDTRSERFDKTVALPDGDTVSFVATPERLSENLGGAGRDLVASFVDVVALPAAVENARLLDGIPGTQSPISLVGNQLDNDLRGNEKANMLHGAGGDDTLDGGAGADSMAGGVGNDNYVVDDAGDRIVETRAGGADKVYTSLTWALGAHQEDLVLTGDAAIDGTGNNLNNVITGNGAANTLLGGGRADTLIGGDGNDLYLIDATDVLIEQAGGDNDTVVANATFALPDHIEVLRFNGTANVRGDGNAENNFMLGNVGNNRLLGYDGNDTLNGGIGNDTLQGGEGADSLVGGEGFDRLDGGNGDDTYLLVDADQVIELANAGIDTVLSNISYTLPNAVENLSLLGNGDLSGTGNALDNVLIGNAGANVLRGLGGHDRLSGGQAGDTLEGGTGGDTLTGSGGLDQFLWLSPLEGGDTVADFRPGDDKLAFAAGGFGGLAVVTLSQNAAAGGTAQFVYTKATGVLEWDADGTGGIGAVAIATLSNKPTLAAGDFAIV